MNHQCKMGFGSVLDADNVLNKNIGNSIIQLLEESPN